MLIFIDLETTGLESSDVICSIAIVNREKYIYNLINAGKKIPAIASSIHHITNEDIQDKPAFTESEAYKYLNNNNSVENILVAHNIQFDLGFLASHGLHWKGGIIDTLKVTRHLVPECEQFSLQILRYELRLYREERVLYDSYGIKDALSAHNALGDALVTKLLYGYLLEMADDEKMQELSFTNVLLSKFSFGKYKGRYIEEICMNDRSYVEWLVTSDIDEDMKYSINYYIQG